MTVPRLKLPHLATVERMTAGPKDRLGVPTEIWATVGEPVRVYRQRTGGREVLTPAGETAVAEYLIFAGPNPPFAATDRLAIDGALHELLDVDPDVAARGHHSETLARVVAARQVP